jgi:predicted nucleic acid-binding protein
LRTANKAYVLDANAILEEVQNGPGAGTVERLFREAHRSQTTLMISVVNLGEVFYWVWSNKGETSARKVINDLERLPLQIIPVDLSLALKAGELKAIHKIPYADAVAAALALAQNATVVTSDRDFERLGRRVSVLWLSRPPRT